MNTQAYTINQAQQSKVISISFNSSVFTRSILSVLALIFATIVDLVMIFSSLQFGICTGHIQKLVRTNPV